MNTLMDEPFGLRSVTASGTFTIHWDASEERLMRKSFEVVFYVEVPNGANVEMLKGARISVPGWPDYGFRGEVQELREV